MSKQSTRPYVPTGSYADKGKANDAIKYLPYACKVVPNKNGTYSIVRTS